MASVTIGDEVALLAQTYLQQLIASDELFNDIPVLLEDDGNVETQMDIALGIVTEKADAKCGACVLVRQPAGCDDEMPGVIHPPLRLEWDILCMEWRDVNRKERGTGKRAWSLARRIHRLCKAHRAPGLLQNVTVRKPAIVKANFPRELINQTIPVTGYLVRLASAEADIYQYSKVRIPSVTADPALSAQPTYATGVAGATVTVTPAEGTPAIYYTKNLSCPSPNNAASTLYTGPFAAEAGTYLFRSFVDGQLGSDSVAVKFT